MSGWSIRHFPIQYLEGVRYITEFVIQDTIYDGKLVFSKIQIVYIADTIGIPCRFQHRNGKLGGVQSWMIS